MSTSSWYNFKVLIYEPDYYARHAINSFLAWDRRTRVTFRAASLDEMHRYLDSVAEFERPDYVLLDVTYLTPDALSRLLKKLRKDLPKARLVCLSQHAAPELVRAAVDEDARAFLLKQEVNLRLGWTLVYAETRDFVITSGVRDALKSAGTTHPRVSKAAILPGRIELPMLTPRVREALELWVGGMPAYLVADELGIGLSTVRGYVKKAYRILEETVVMDFPEGVTQQERAFLRYTALNDHESR
jgi:DNA-binding NarL/FixJ family response regulator